MKNRTITSMLAALCLTGLSGCRSAESKPVSDTAPAVSDTTAAAPEEITITTKAYVERTLSDEIPAKAVMKVKSAVSENGEQKSVYLKYLDDHDNPLLSIKNPDDAGKSEIFLNAEYEYNENGDEIYHRMISKNADEEYYTEYDSSGRISSEKVLKKGVLSSQTKYEYDEYGNVLREKYARFDENGTLSGESVEDDSDCDYDGSGHMITVRQPDKTTEYTYDSEGRVLTETVRYAGDEKKEQKTEYAYDPLTGKETLKDLTFTADGKTTTRIRAESEYDSNQNPVQQVVTNYAEDGAVRVVTTKTEYDSEGRQTVITKTVSDSGDISVTKNEYETIG